MDLALSKEEQAFQDEVRAFLDEKLDDSLREAGRLTGGVFAEFEYGLRWHKILNERGWAAPSWPEEYGGPGWSVIQRYIFETETARANAPRIFNMGVQMVGPVVMKFGTDEQKADILPKILSGEYVFCQGYSEPGSGSDLASLQLRAEDKGDHYLLNGSKIWTTYAHHANMMFCLVRTSKEGKPQEGITFLIFDRTLPGITVDPIITLAGDHEVNQVFFENVVVPKGALVGEENRGWTVAKYLLEHERGGGTYSPRLKVKIEKLKKIAESEQSHGGRLIDDAGFRRRIAEAEIMVTALEYTEKRVISAIAQRGRPGAESSMMKLRGSEVLQHVSELAVEAMAHYGLPYQPEARIPGANIEPIGPDYGLTAMPQHLNNRAATIYAGSSEVQRNIIAKAVLGL
jgi:alkylation response protein AidB-like acyl-CoA dehydrogenase